MTTSSIPESIVQLGLMTGALGMVPLCRRWVGGPLWIYITSACGLAILVSAEVRQIILGMQFTEDMPPVAWYNVALRGLGAFLALTGFSLWVRHVQKAKQELSQLATTDPLTHLSNRRHGTLMLRHEINRARRNSKPLSVLAIDVDKLKPVNDGYGHLAGDALLKQVASLMRQRLRTTDIVARFGGDEFVAILPESDAAAALQVAIELRQTFYDNPAQYGELQIPVQASFGVAELPAEENLKPEALMSRADEALYAVKKRGGNGVIDWATLKSKPGDRLTPSSPVLTPRPN
jgi:diguanylate cyclase (GGDEF)-like protein